MNQKIFQKLKQSYSYIGLAENVLQMHADALAATGFVTEENIDEVVSKQKSYLEGLQKYNDTRVGEALKKAAEKATKDAEEKARLAAEEAARKKQEELEKNLPDSVKTFMEQVKADREAEKKAQEAAKQEAEESRKTYEAEMQKRFDEMQKTITGFREENEGLKRAEAARQRQANILAKAKELGIPQYRIDEGFVIPEEATEQEYTATLTTIAQNIKANALPGRGGAGATIPAGDATKEEVSSIADSLVSRL